MPYRVIVKYLFFMVLFINNSCSWQRENRCTWVRDAGGETNANGELIGYERHVLEKNIPGFWKASWDEDECKFPLGCKSEDIYVLETGEEQNNGKFYATRWDENQNNWVVFADNLVWKITEQDSDNYYFTITKEDGSLWYSGYAFGSRTGGCTDIGIDNDYFERTENPLEGDNILHFNKWCMVSCINPQP